MRDNCGCGAVRSLIGYRTVHTANDNGRMSCMFTHRSIGFARSFFGRSAVITTQTMTGRTIMPGRTTKPTGPAFISAMKFARIRSFLRIAQCLLSVHPSVIREPTTDGRNARQPPVRARGQRASMLYDRTNRRRNRCTTIPSELATRALRAGGVWTDRRTEGGGASRRARPIYVRSHVRSFVRSFPAGRPSAACARDGRTDVLTNE